jgi:hypothetical protein
MTEAKAADNKVNQVKCKASVSLLPNNLAVKYAAHLTRLSG